MGGFGVENIKISVLQMTKILLRTYCVFESLWTIVLGIVKAFSSEMCLFITTKFEWKECNVRVLNIELCLKWDYCC